MVEVGAGFPSFSFAVAFVCFSIAVSDVALVSQPKPPESKPPSPAKLVAWAAATAHLAIS